MVFKGSLACGVLCLFSITPFVAWGAGSGEQPTADQGSEQAPPSDVRMSEEACLLLIQQTESTWQTYNGWASYRADRTSHRNRDNIARAAANIKDFSRGLNAEERGDINDFLSGDSGDATSVTRLLNEANTRIARLSAIRENDGGPDPEGNNSELYRIQFRITMNPRAVRITAGGRYRYNYDYLNNLDVEKKYAPLGVNLSTPDAEQTAADAAAETAITKNIAATSPDVPHYATREAFMVGQKLVPASCFIKPKPAPPPRPSVSEDREDRRRLDDIWYRDFRFDRMDHFRVGGARR
jgi:hypothetical protein